MTECRFKNGNFLHSHPPSSTLVPSYHQDTYWWANQETQSFIYYLLRSEQSYDWMTRFVPVGSFLWSFSLACREIRWCSHRVWERWRSGLRKVEIGVDGLVSRSSPGEICVCFPFQKESRCCSSGPVEVGERQDWTEKLCNSAVK